MIVFGLNFELIGRSLFVQVFGTEGRHIAAM
jgi:hypothetical protein